MTREAGLTKEGGMTKEAGDTAQACGRTRRQSIPILATAAFFP